MKRTNLIGVFIFFAIGSQAQIRILPGGNVGIGTNSPTGKMHVMGSIYQTGGANTIRILPNNPGTEMGSSTDRIDFWYPGTDYNKLYAEDYFKISDSALKENIMPISDALDKVMALRGVSYTMKSNGDNAIPVIEYGFIAQEAESVIKNISEKGDKGYLGMDYDEVIPFLVEAIKEQQAIIEDMRLNCCHSEKSSIQAPSQSDENNVVDSPRLFQNKPNPYRESTQIEYYLPKNTMHAEILIFDLQGALVRTYKLSGTGTNVLRVDAASLKAGMYHYSLIVNDTVSDTKKMILTE